MAAIVYILCSVTSAACAFLLLRSWISGRSRFLFFASLCFAFLAMDNAILFIDLVLVTNEDLRNIRTGCALTGLLCFVYGLIFESDAPRP